MKILLIVVAVIALLVLVVYLYTRLPRFGRLPSGERLEKIQKLPYYKDGKFQNTEPTQRVLSMKGLKTMFEFDERLSPDSAVYVEKHDLKNLPADKDYIVWFGHSSYLLQLSGKKFLVDPVFLQSSPVSFVNKPFKGTDVFKPEDLPDFIDYLVISHDHWDHLDYKIVTALKDRIGKVICPIGVGEHFECWGFSKNKLVELCWNEEYVLENDYIVDCLEARHFSGRGFSQNKSLWASYMLTTPSMRVYIGGDSGYGGHFKQIGERFNDIDLAILENGQYNKQWSDIHCMPEHLGEAARDLNAEKVITVHHSKFALARHAWDEPLKNELEAAEQYNLNLIVTEIGKITYLNKDRITEPIDSIQ